MIGAHCRTESDRESRGFLPHNDVELNECVLSFWVGTLSVISDSPDISSTSKRWLINQRLNEKSTEAECGGLEYPRGSMTSFKKNAFGEVIFPSST